MTAAATRTERIGGAERAASDWDPRNWPRVEIDIGTGRLHEHADVTWAAILGYCNGPEPNGEEPQIFLHGNDVVRLDERGNVSPHNKHTLRDLAARAAKFVVRGDNGRPRETYPNAAIIDNLLARNADEYDPETPRVDQIVDVPIVLPDRSVLDKPGYCAEHRILYRPAPGLEGLRVPGRGEVEWIEEVIEACDFLMDDWLGDFGFANHASKANALAELLTPPLRAIIEGGTPLHPLIAVEGGWGKGLLTDACTIPFCGEVTRIPGADSDEEWRKAITAALRKMPAALVFDNLTGELKSPALMAVLTTGRWEDRVLGESKTVVIEPRCLWSVNGNNLTLHPDLVERCPAPIELGPGPYWTELCERKARERKPWGPDRKPRDQERAAFDHPERREWMLDNRRRAVEAAMVLIRHYLDGPIALLDGGHRLHRLELEFGPDPVNWDMPALVHPRLDGLRGEFAGWQKAVGGALAMADVPGFRENYADWAQSVDDRGDEAAAFLEGLLERFGDEPVAMRTIVATATTPQDRLREALPAELLSHGANPDRLSGPLAAWLRDHSGARHGDYRLDNDGKSSRRRWWVRRLGQ